jgi:hypothetical protein
MAIAGILSLSLGFYQLMDFNSKRIKNRRNTINNGRKRPGFLLCVILMTLGQKASDFLL